ncbi:ankyrin repeat-containing domain protein [Thelephora terrestris]|uniref:Ankyrin repeat-containing domain protein n=1 Tax=Thelephora terrestris TaxID=56493 RepID=A0A9P6LBM7_9AGAM|nr:ankyrin repeat-containing domain protein [Thelephora terrestris]
MARQKKNIWVAAGDGDLDEVQARFSVAQFPHLLSISLGLSPNAPDQNTYTPMHAAASYGHIEILEYLISQGGNVNVTDEDGDTPLYAAENVETAQWLINHGATVDIRNSEEISPIEHLEEEFPAVAAYLRSISNSDQHIREQPSQHTQNIASEFLTSGLLSTVQEIMERSEREGTDPDEELRAAVGRTVIDGVITGFDLGEAANASRREDDGHDGAKRPRMGGT